MSVQQTIDECRELDRMGRTEDAVRFLSESIESEPSHELYYERGTRNEALGKYSAALDNYTAAMESSATAVFKYWLARGCLLSSRLGLYEDAIDNFKLAEIIDPTSALPIQYLSLCYFELGQFEDSKRQAARAILLAPNDTTPYMCLAQCALSQKQYSVAIDHLKKALSIDSELPTYWSALARAYNAVGDTENARLCYKKAIDLKASANSLIALAKVELEAGNPKAAIECLNSARELDLNEGESIILENYLESATTLKNNPSEN